MMVTFEKEDDLTIQTLPHTCYSVRWQSFLNLLYPAAIK
jgi:hypothetical protein